MFARVMQRVWSSSVCDGHLRRFFDFLAEVMVTFAFFGRLPEKTPIPPMFSEGDYQHLVFYEGAEGDHGNACGGGGRLRVDVQRGGIDGAVSVSGRPWLCRSN